MLTAAAGAQDAAAAADKEAAYTRTVTARAEKIVATLGLADAKKAGTVTTLIADEYKYLNAVYESRDEQLKAAKETVTDKDALTARRKSIEDAAAPKIQALHDAFLKNLSSQLTQEQITKVKDGLTYNVVNVTYTAMLDMIPTLKPAEKEQIMAWLVEAREHAMDAESSEKKHGWFGKYKGRINNYLAARGYDLQKERAAWQERIKTKEEAKKTAQNN